MLWIIGVAILPSVGWAVSVMNNIYKIKDNTEQSLHILEHADDFGLGNSKQSKIIEDNTRVMKELVHYIKWASTKQAGENPPPYVGE